MTVPLNRLHPEDRDALLAKWWEGDSIGNGEDSDRQHGLLCDALIKKFVKIEPFHEGPCPSGVFSYGLGSYGYDIRVGYKFKVFANTFGAVVDPKAMTPKAFVDVDLTPKKHEWITDFRAFDSGRTEVSYTCSTCGNHSDGGSEFHTPCGAVDDHVVIPPNSFALAEAVEYLEIPRSVLVIGIGKSSYARTGIILNVTPVEPEWRGKLTLEISNTTPLPVKVYPNEGICQLVFFKAPIECLVSYADKKGKYQDQKGLTLPFVVKTSG